jgi:hypothetical protein
LNHFKICQNKRIKFEAIKEERSKKYYIIKLKSKFFGIMKNVSYINKKIQKFYSSSMKNKKNKIYRFLIFKRLKEIIINMKSFVRDIKIKMEKIRKVKINLSAREYSQEVFGIN